MHARMSVTLHQHLPNFGLFLYMLSILCDIVFLISDEADNHLTDMVEELLLCLRPLEFNMMEEFHMSLSRTVTIRHHWIQSLIDSLQSKISTLSRYN